VKVAAVQFAPVWGNKAGNLVRLNALIDQAIEKGAELIVLPELAATGYSFLSILEASEVGECLTNENATDLPHYLYRSLHRKNAAVVAGLVEIDGVTSKLYNSQVYVEPTKDGGGWVRETYRKVNRWGNDFIWAEAGSANPPIVHSERFGKRIGLLICRDVRDKSSEIKNFYSKGEADIVCFSSNWGVGGFPAVSWMEFAEDNQVTLIVSNRYMKERHNDFGHGGICIISPEGKVNLEGLVFDQDCIVYGDA